MMTLERYLGSTLMFERDDSESSVKVVPGFLMYLYQIGWVSHVKKFAGRIFPRDHSTRVPSSYMQCPTKNRPTRYRWILVKTLKLSIF